MCRKARAREWSVRLTHELSYNNKAVFLTLTYDNDHLPENLSVSIDELQRFFKRLRKNYDEKVKIKYYACGEYGENFGRPHYHSIIFNIGQSDIDVIKKSWTLGQVFIGTVTIESCRYVANYIQKRQSKNMQLGLREKPFAIMSKGLGLAYAIENADQLRRTLSSRIQGKEVGLPRYYQKKLEITTEELRLRSLDHAKEIESLHTKRIGGESLNGEPETASIQASRVQAVRNAMSRDNLKQSRKDC